MPVQAGLDALDVKRQQKRALKLCVYQVMQELYPVATPWGSLTGIRPTKLFREIAGRQGEAEARRSFRELFTVSPEKQSLVEEITGRGRRRPGAPSGSCSPCPLKSRRWWRRSPPSSGPISNP